MELQPNTLLKGGTYRIIDILGKGGFGITYLAEHTHMGRKVCIKEFFPTTFYRRDEVSQTATIKDEDNTVMCERFKQKFLKEARTISTLDNPHIVRVFDSFEEHGTAYYVMEYIEGESLQSLVSRKGVLDEAAARRYISQVADALAYIHERNTLHLDIKPSNIMVRKSDGRAILIDFGLAKHYDEDSGSQTTTTIGGHSDGYAPIEQYDTGGIQMFSPETDIYSLGATLYFLVTGERPPRARVVGKQGLPAMPSKLSTSLRTAVESAMQFSIKQRPHSVTEFITTLDGGRDTKRKSRWWLWLLLLLLITVGGFVGYMMSGGDEPEPTPEPTPTSSTGGENVVNLDSLNRVDAASLRLNSSSVDVGYDGGSNSVSYRLENSLDYLKVECTTNKSWITDIKSSNNKISFTVKANNEHKSRSGIITVDYGTNSYRITVTQAARPATTFTLAKSSLTVDSSGGSHSVGYTIEHPIDGASVSVSDNQSWITNPSATGGKITFKTTSNTSTESRSGIITVDYGTKSYSITVTQAARPAPTFTLDKSSLTVDSSGGSYSVGYTIEHPINGASVNVSDNQSWITNLSASGGNITFKTTDNTSTESRTGTITATYNGITRQITVTQKGFVRTGYTETAYGISMKMVWVEGGSFKMGSDIGESDEQPVHNVTLDGYWIGATEVTQAQWESVMGTDIRQQRDKADSSWSIYGEGSNYPMYYVNYDEAKEFCRRLSERTGRSYTLPTEAQWEYAARGGRDGVRDNYTYSGSNSIGSVAWYGNSGNSTNPVGRKSPNQLGLYDMSGNLWEWCLDYYGSYSSSSQTNPTGPSSGDYRVLRGGSWDYYESHCRVTYRGYINPSIRDLYMGFRVVCLP